MINYKKVFNEITKQFCKLDYSAKEILYCEGVNQTIWIALNGTTVYKLPQKVAMLLNLESLRYSDIINSNYIEPFEYDENGRYPILKAEYTSEPHIVKAYYDDDETIYYNEQLLNCFKDFNLIADDTGNVLYVVNRYTNELEGFILPVNKKE